MRNRSIIAFADGNPKDPKTWSNVPFYALRELEKEGYSVYTVDLTKGFKFFIKISNRILRTVLGRDTMCLVNLWWIFGKIYQIRINKALREYPQPDFMLFFTYSTSGNPKNKIPSVLFCDFTVDYNIHCIQKRKAKWYERSIIRRQDNILKHAYRIVSLFPLAAKHYEEYYGSNNVTKVPGHIINCDYEIEDEGKCIADKFHSNKILFIGRKTYLNGAKCLIQAVESIRRSGAIENLQLVIIGMNESVLGIDKKDYVKCYSFLDKSIKDEKEKYYSEILDSKIIINTTDKWAGMSSIVESMYLFTPVITTAYNEFVEIFGKEIGFGNYCEAENSNELISSIKNIYSSDFSSYRKMAICAHDSVEDFTWEKCVQAIID